MSIISNLFVQIPYRHVSRHIWFWYLHFSWF